MSYDDAEKRRKSIQDTFEDKSGQKSPYENMLDKVGLGDEKPDPYQEALKRQRERAKQPSY